MVGWQQGLAAAAAAQRMRRRRRWRAPGAPPARACVMCRCCLPRALSVLPEGRELSRDCLSPSGAGVPSRELSARTPAMATAGCHKRAESFVRLPAGEVKGRSGARCSQAQGLSFALRDGILATL